MSRACSVWRKAHASSHCGRDEGTILAVGRGDEEACAGTGGLSAQVLPLLTRGLHSYTFSDVSAGFFPGAMQKLAAYPEVETQIFDLEKPGTGQGFDAGSFDFIIGTNVLHAVSDVRVALGHLHELLVPMMKSNEPASKPCPVPGFSRSKICVSTSG